MCFVFQISVGDVQARKKHDEQCADESGRRPLYNTPYIYFAKT